MDLIGIIDKLKATRDLTDSEWKALLDTEDEEVLSYLSSCARQVRESIYGKAVYIRGLIEFTNYCKNGCYYCGINCSNTHADRYRLTDEQILACVSEGYELGFRTFVLQGGEDPFYTDDKIVSIVRAIKEMYPDCAVTLSIGEKSEESYRAYFEAGADRYLLRHETASPEHYRKLHPENLSWEHRMNCLKTLRKIGYQVGCGFMIGSPYQTTDNIISDLRFIAEFKPDMCGIGPFIPHKDTVFKEEPAGTLEMTLKLLSIIRLLVPDVLLPATTALGTIHPEGREKGLRSGANVVMPNLSPVMVREKYSLYDGKICLDSESAQCIKCLSARVASSGYEIVVDRGDHKNA
ncbi:MAG: [Clostridiales bacterium]|nr:[FeFe] hydrogenase H-cluster radical SAM maturase HydE [Clostridiales bacterium]